MAFVHLHLHSEYSLLDGASRISEIPKRAKECGHTAVALTDHGVMYGMIPFYNACKKEGIKPIVGCEVYVAPKSRFDKGNSQTSPYHLVLLCKNETGYKNLLTLVSKAYTEGFYSKPRVDIELLREHSDGLIALSACVAGKIPRSILEGNYDIAKDTALEYQKIFGEGNFYIEIQNHSLEIEKEVLPSLVKLSEETNIPLVATNDCHYLRRKDADAQAVLMCIQMNRQLSDGRPMGFETDEFYYKDTNEMKMLFGKYKGAIENTEIIADMCNLEIEEKGIVLPKFPCPKGLTSAEYLESVVNEGFEKRQNLGFLRFDNHSKSEYEERIKYELSVIIQMGYADYFLIVYDYVNFARKSGIPVGPGRGSGAGSLVAYLLYITDVDPIEFDLLFERFLNPERVSMPDIDMDFCDERRDEVIDYVSEKYGSDHVSHIVTFGTLAAKAAVRDVGRAIGMPYSEVDAIASKIPRELGITLDKALEDKDFLEIYNKNQKARELIDIARTIEGMPRNASIHAAGIVITDKPLFDYVPIALSNGIVVAQYDMDAISKLGLLKFDFLALRYLTIIRDTELQIKAKDKSFDIEKIPLDDKEAFEIISIGNTDGLFQLESGGMTKMLTNMKPKNIEDIISAISLYRPGPMDSIPKFLACREGKEKIDYPIECLEPILKSTFGVVVYQEQVMNIFRTCANYTFGHADIVRRAMAKKKYDALVSEKENFLLGCQENGIDKAKAEKLFDDMISFANYAFNKSHACAYSIISYRTAYLKAHYTREFFASLLKSVLGNMEKTAEYIAELNKMSIGVLPPDINKSEKYYHVSDNNIRFGLLGIKNVGEQFIDRLIAERQKADFASFEDFIERMSGYDMNKRQIESMIKAGVFDSLKVYRSRLLLSYEQLIDSTNDKMRNNVAGQLDIFSMVQNNDEAFSFKYPEVPELDNLKKLNFEKEATGLYFSGHPLDAYEKNIKDIPHDEIIKIISESDEDEIENYPIDKKVTLCGVISSITKKNTQKGDKMAFFILSDHYSEIEVIVFPKQFDNISSILFEDSPIMVDGRITKRDDEGKKVILSFAKRLVDNNDYQSKNDVLGANSAGIKKDFQNKNQNKPSKLYVKINDFESEEFRKFRAIAEIFEGSVPLIYFDAKKKTYIPSGISVEVDDYIIKQMKDIVGDDNVVVK